jgi:hypothetical protein
MPVYILTQAQFEAIRDQLKTASERCKALEQSPLEERNLRSRLAHDSESLFNYFVNAVGGQTDEPDNDGIVDIISELQGRLPRGTAVTLLIPPSRHDRA